MLKFHIGVEISTRSAREKRTASRSALAVDEGGRRLPTRAGQSGGWSFVLRGCRFAEDCPGNDCNPRASTLNGNCPKGQHAHGFFDLHQRAWGALAEPAATGAS